MNTWSLLKYLFLVSIGILGSLYKSKTKKEKYGILSGIGQLIKPRFPALQVYYLLSTIIINMSFIVPSFQDKDYLLGSAYTISMFLYTAFYINRIVRDRKKVLIYENGIEVNENEIHKDKMIEYRKIEDNKYIIKRKHHRDIVFQQIENLLSDDKESREEIISRVFPENKKSMKT